MSMAAFLAVYALFQGMLQNRVDAWICEDEKRMGIVRISAVLVEFSAVLAGISASTAEFSGMPMLFCTLCRRVFL